MRRGNVEEVDSTGETIQGAFKKQVTYTPQGGGPGSR